MDLFFLLRPSQFIPILSTVMLGLVYPRIMKGLGAFAPGFIPADWWLMLAGMALIYGGVFVINQIADEETDRRNGKLMIIPWRLVTPVEAWISYGVCSLAGLVSLWLVSGVELTLGDITVVLGYLYSATPFRWKDKLVRSVWINFSGGLVAALAGLWWVMPHTAFSVFVSVEYGLAWAAVHIWVGIPDMEGDAATGKETVSVKYGAPAARRTVILLAVVSLLIAVLIHDLVYLAVSGMSVAVILTSSLVTRADFFLPVKVIFLLLMVLSGLYYPEFILLNIALILALRGYYKKRFNVVYP